jgi:hypothetical protein
MDTKHICNGCRKKFLLSKLHIDEGDSLLCDDCFLAMMNEFYGTDFKSLEEAGYPVD